MICFGFGKLVSSAYSVNKFHFLYGLAYCNEAAHYTKDLIQFMIIIRTSSVMGQIFPMNLGRDETIMLIFKRLYGNEKK